jgi:molybdenum cofactor synthesis domain-containing protein
MFKLGVLTISTSGFHGQREDTSGNAIREVLAPPEYECLRYEVVSDEKEMIADRLRKWSDEDGVDLVVTTGGTGVAPRDVTPEACLSVIEKEVPGLAEAMRSRTLEKTPSAMLSRSVAGIRGRTLIITLPGSPRGVRECLEVVLPVLPHALELLKDQARGHPTDSDTASHTSEHRGHPHSSEHGASEHGASEHGPGHRDEGQGHHPHQGHGEHGHHRH